MRKPEKKSVLGVEAPGPRATPWAALLVAGALSVGFLALLGLWRLATLAVG